MSEQRWEQQGRTHQALLLHGLGLDILWDRAGKKGLVPSILGCWDSWEVGERQEWLHQGPVCYRMVLQPQHPSELTAFAGPVQTPISNTLKWLCALLSGGFI